MQNDRVGEFDHLQALLATDDTRYGLQERRNDLTDEVFVDEKTGNVNKADVRRRAEELYKLQVIKKRMIARLQAGKAVAHRVRKTYTTIIGRLRRAVKAATSGKKGKASKARKKAAESYRAQIRDYLSRRKEWEGKEQEIGFDLEDAGIDLTALTGERAGVLGTKAVPQEPPDTPDPADAGDPDAPLGTDPSPADDGPGGDTAPTEASAPTAEDIARGVAQQFATFQQSRADLFSSFGGNFIRSTVPVGFGGDLQNAAGTRYFGGGSSGTDGGVLAGGGGEAGGPSVVQNIHFTAPTPPDPHVFTAASLHELQAALS